MTNNKVKISDKAKKKTKNWMAVKKELKGKNKTYNKAEL